MTQGGKTGIWHAGFTITEVLIVLAVTGFLFFTAFMYINGRQNRTEFQVGIREVRQSFQQVINEVASGYYPDSTAFSCNPLSTPVGIDATTGTGQGTKNGCIFMGKVFTAGQWRAKNIGVFSLAGSRLITGTSKDVTTPLEAKPAAIAKGASTNTSGPVDITTSFDLPNGITFKWAEVTTNGTSTWTGTHIPASASGSVGVAVVSSLANFGGAVASAQQTLQLYYLQSPKWGTTGNVEKEADAINDEVTAGSVVSKWGYMPQRAKFCFASGGTNQSGLVTIGSIGGGMAVTLDIKTGTDCA